MVVALAAALLLASSAATARNNHVVMRKEIPALNKNTFFNNLSTGQTMLVGFTMKGQSESENMLDELEMFAGSAQDRYPDLEVYKVDQKMEPYLTARMLLENIPELHLLVRDSSGKWGSHAIDAEISAEDLISYMDNQGWLQHSGGMQGSNICTPFNLCGRAFGAFAEKSVAFERALPIPKWLAVILIPALIAFAGRFIIESMYSAEDQVLGVIGKFRSSGAATDAHVDDVSEGIATEPKKSK
ncbi:hypothetical protein IWW45_006529 [Coemansia sp. RSA 485]|nr:hypothetical protein IWW45_006529 [Coemansia sp. RSA 485]